MSPRPQTPGLGLAARRRAYAAAAAVTAALCGIGYKAWGLQVDDGARFRAVATRQHQRTVEVAATRGPILDARGRALAVTADADSVYANSRRVVDVTGTAEKLGGIVDGDVRVLEARLASGRSFVWLDRHITPEQAEKIRTAKLPGIEIAQEPRRWYPARASGGPVLGFAGIDGEGLDGLELSLDKKLRGERARFAALRDAPGKTIAADGIVDAAPGATVTLTLDRAIQAFADEALAKAIAQNQARSGVVVVIDVATGGVLAMASSPTYDPNAPVGRGESRNRAVTDVYEIGSVMKLFTVAAALDADLVRPDESWAVELVKIGSKTLRDVHRDLTLTTSGIIKRSSNVGAVKIGQRLGRERLYAALKEYGFGKRTAIELPGEQGGVVRDGKRWRDIELATISYGYGLTVTPLQLAAAVAAIGNRGVYLPPRIVSRIVSADGKVAYELAPEGRRIMREQTAAALLPMMASVFEGGKQAGTAGTVVVPGFVCGGKTGTARKIDHATKTYSKSRYLSSFAGLAPIDAPRIAVVAVIDEPTGIDYYGGKVAGPVFAEVASQTLRYLGVPGQALPAPANAKKPAAEPPDEEPPALPTEELIPVVEDGEVAVPDFRGLGVAKALAAARQAGISIEIEGSGRAVTQSPPPGPSPIGTSVKVTFSDGIVGGDLPAR